MPFFVQITPISAEDLSQQKVVISREERAKELHLNSIESAVLLSMSPAIHIRFISIDNTTKITQLVYPMRLTLWTKNSVRYLPQLFTITRFITIQWMYRKPKFALLCALAILGVA